MRAISIFLFCAREDAQRAARCTEASVRRSRYRFSASAIRDESGGVKFYLIKSPYNCDTILIRGVCLCVQASALLQPVVSSTKVPQTLNMLPHTATVAYRETYGVWKLHRDQI